MTEMPESARRLLEALVEIESHAVEVARVGGCCCNEPVPEQPDRSFPIATFSREQSVGKPFNQIQWTMRHQEGCPMFGQRGVGLTTYGSQ